MIVKQGIPKLGENPSALVLILVHTSFLVTGDLVGKRQHWLIMPVAWLQLETVDITKRPKLLLLL